eukprot:jgi/Mesen1/5070/ME000252S04186
MSERPLIPGEEPEVVEVSPHPVLHEHSGQPAVQLRDKKADAFLYFCRILAITAVVCALLCAVVNLLAALGSFKKRHSDTHVNTAWLGVLRVYGVIFAVFVAVAETELPIIFKACRILETWVGRGMLQIFVAVMTKALARSNSASDATIFFSFIAGWLLLIVGIFYTVAGLFCMGHLKRSRIRSQKDRENALKEYEELERRRAELQGMLGHGEV